MQTQFRIVAAVAAAGVIGAAARWALATTLDGDWALLIANVVGCAVVGWAAARHQRTRSPPRQTAAAAGPAVSPWLAAGFCGALTSMSALALQLARYLDDGRHQHRVRMARADDRGLYCGVRERAGRSDHSTRPAMTALGVIVGFGIAAAVGTVLRWRISTALGPGGTLLINLSGAFILGLLASTGSAAMTIIGTAGLGALTTVSGIFPESARLSRASPLLALGYISLTITGTTAAAAVGLALA